MHSTLEPDVEMAALGQKLGHGILNSKSTFHDYFARFASESLLFNVTLLLFWWNDNRVEPR